MDQFGGPNLFIADNTPEQVVSAYQTHFKELESLDPTELRKTANAKLKRLAEEFGAVPVDYYGIAFNAAQSLSHAINKVIVDNPHLNLLAQMPRG